MNIDYILRLLILAGLAIGTITWLIYWKKSDKCRRNYAVAPILFGFNALTYSVASALNLLSKEIYLIWGDIVSIHGVIIMISIGIVLIQLSEGGKK